jgi:hypothetical protein
MNESQLPRVVYLTMEWEYMDGVLDGFDLAIPVWLDVQGNCLNETTKIGVGVNVFNVSMKSGWSPKFTGDLYRRSGHTHDGNVKQDVYLDGKIICENVPGYGESEGFIAHVGMYGHEKEGTQPDPDHDHDEPEEPGREHDHNSSDHIMHISSITGCKNLGKIGPSNKITLTTVYNMTAHTPMDAPSGGLEPIMGIEFMHVARPKDEAMKDILAGKQPNNDLFIERVTENPGVRVGV